MTQGPPHVIIMDIRRAPTPPVTHLRSHASWIAQHGETMRKSLLGVVFVADSPMLRGALEALFWMQPMPTKSIVAARMDTAVRALRPLLAEQGISEHVPAFADDPTEMGEPISP